MLGQLRLIRLSKMKIWLIQRNSEMNGKTRVAHPSFHLVAVGHGRITGSMTVEEIGLVNALVMGAMERQKMVDILYLQRMVEEMFI